MASPTPLSLREPPGAQRPSGRRASGMRPRPPLWGGLKTYRKYSQWAMVTWRRPVGHPEIRRPSWTRILRRWYAAKGLTKRVRRPRLDQVTGRIPTASPYRIVTVRKRLFRYNRGFVTVNDGPTMAFQLACYLIGLPLSETVNNGGASSAMASTTRRVAWSAGGLQSSAFALRSWLLDAM